MATSFGEGIEGVLEKATITVSESGPNGFEAILEKATSLIASSEGFLGMSVLAGIERPKTYVLLINWESLEDHQAFRSSPAFPKWRELISPYFAADPEVEHLREVLAKKS